MDDDYLGDDEHLANDDDYDLLGTAQEGRVSPVFASEKFPAKKTAPNQETREQEKQL